MARKTKWADIPAGHDSPLDYAVSARDRSVIDMVEAGDPPQAGAARLSARGHRRATGPPGLLRGVDSRHRRNRPRHPRARVHHQVETRESGRIIDCLALEKGLPPSPSTPTCASRSTCRRAPSAMRRWMRTAEQGARRRPHHRRAADPRDHRKLGHAGARTGHRFHDRTAGAGASALPSTILARAIHLSGSSRISTSTSSRSTGSSSAASPNADNQVLAAALLSIGQQFDMVTVAESVERAEDAAYLTALGIDCLQGYYFGAPTVRPPWLDETGFAQATADVTARLRHRALPLPRRNGGGDLAHMTRRPPMARRALHNPGGGYP